jgi:hypothetical protein
MDEIFSEQKKRTTEVLYVSNRTLSLSFFVLSLHS